MELPATGATVAVRYKRNPNLDTDPALTPCLFLGHVLRHEETGGFTASLMSYDNLPQETYIEWDEENETWADRDFLRPVEWVRSPLNADVQALLTEFECLPEHMEHGGDVRPLEELRLRFLSAAIECGWVEEQEGPAVYYSDDFPDPGAKVARWHAQPLGPFTVTADCVEFEWPVEDRDPSEWKTSFHRRDDGLFEARSEAFGDEFEASLEDRGAYHLLTGYWQSEEFLSFFAAVLPKPAAAG